MVKVISSEIIVEDKLNLAAAVYQVSSAAMAIMDAQCHILDINPAFADITGFKLAEIVGRPLPIDCDLVLNHATQEEILTSVVTTQPNSNLPKNRFPGLIPAYEYSNT